MARKPSKADLEFEQTLKELMKGEFEEDACPYCSNKNWKVHHRIGEKCEKDPNNKPTETV